MRSKITFFSIKTPGFLNSLQTVNVEVFYLVKCSFKNQVQIRNFQYFTKTVACIFPPKKLFFTTLRYFINSFLYL